MERTNISVRGVTDADGISEASSSELDAIYESVKNWGRWGDDDERGALNHLTDEHRAAAGATVTTGERVSLAHDLTTVPTPESPFPAHHHMLSSGDALGSSGVPGYEATQDYVGTAVHGLGVTHIDALCHMFVGGQMYGGRPASLVKSTGAVANTIMPAAEGIVGRGVVLDIPAVPRRAVSRTRCGGHRRRLGGRRASTVRRCRRR